MPTTPNGFATLRQIKPLIDKGARFPLPTEAVKAFENLKSELSDSCLGRIDEDEPLVVECDASNVAIAVVLSQRGKPVAFMSRSLRKSENRYPAVEKEATAIIEAVRKWAHFLHVRHFTLITDQCPLQFMLDSAKRGKKLKIQSWRAARDF